MSNLGNYGLKLATARYINRIRNKAKKRYAKEYLAWLMNRCNGKEPERIPYGLSYMAAQAVRMDLRDLVTTVFD